MENEVLMTNCKNESDTGKGFFLMAYAGLLALIALFCNFAHAGNNDFYDINLRIEPGQPSQNEAVRVVATGGGCNAFVNPDPMNREMEISGNVIRVTVPYFYNNGFCIIPLAVFEWDIGKIPAGSWLLEFYGEDEVLFPRTLLQTIDITIEPAPAPLPAIVPAMERSGTIALICGFLLFGALAFSSAGGSRR